MKNAKKSPFIRVLCAVLSAVTLITSLQTAALAAEQMIEPELSSYLIEFADSDSAAEFESNADIQTLSVNETLVAAELTENHAQALSESDEVVTLEADIIVKANEGEESQEETTLEETAPEEYEEENTEEGTQEETEETEEATESVTWSTKALCAQNLSETGEGVKVAVLDSGLDFYSEVAPAGIVDFVDPEFARGDDMTGHGTAVSGIIAAPEDESGIIGIAPDAELYSVRVLDESNEAPISRIISGIDWCIENEVDIINMSFGTSEYSALLEEKIEEAAQAGILLIASAGNGESVQYPAKFTEVIAVGSVTSAMVKAEDSATGGELEFVAPGENVYSTSLLGGYGALSGTSIASPHIAGAAAVLLGKDTTKSPEFIRALLAASCKTLGEAESYGNGIPDLAFALQIYDDFAQNYTDSTYQPPQNTGNPENFTQEDVYVKGCWNDAEHEYITKYYYDTTNFNIRIPQTVKRVSKTTDLKNYFTKNKYYKGYGDSLWFHAIGNYVVMAKLLYEIAVNYKVKGVDEFTHDANTNLFDGYYDVSKCYRYDDFAELLGKKANYKRIMLNITDMLDFYDSDTVSVDDSLKDMGATDFVSVSEKTSTIVFGMFCHLIGDIYAHRTVVSPLSTATESCTSKGSGEGGNQGLYFIKSDFLNDCGEHEAELEKKEHVGTVSRVPSAAEVIDALIKLILSKGKDSEKVSRFVTLFFSYIFGIPAVYETITSTTYSDTPQRKIDEVLLNQAQRIPSIAKNESENGTHFCTQYGKFSYPCYGILKRVAALGVLQFKDIKYFLKEYVANPDLCSNTQKYYEDPTLDNMFYKRRFLAAKAATLLYCTDFYNSTTATGIVTFKPVYLLPTSTDNGTNIKKYRLKLDWYYTYLKKFDDICSESNKSRVLRKEYWDSVNDNLFYYTTIWHNSCYFIDPDTYTDEEREWLAYPNEVFKIGESHKKATDFYLD